MQHPLDARQFGVRGDGVTDDSLALQGALDAASALGGIVALPPGQYRITRSLRIPVGVHLQGASPAPQYIKPLIGTVILAYHGRDDESAPALFELGDACSVSALTVFYPEQQVHDIRPYSYTFHLVGGDNTVENVTLINSYNGIQIGPQSNVRHRIRSVYGCVLRRGVWLDSCSDIGRLDNIQFHCHWWSSPEVGGNWDAVFEYMWRHCEAFVLGRSDWEYITNTFVFPTAIGYHFIGTEHGSTNAQLSGVGADAAQRCVVVDEIQYMGLLITNGQFVAFTGDDPIEVVINSTCEGSARLVNCAFWGPANQCVVSRGSGYLSLSDCFFSSGKNPAQTRALVEVDGGRLQMRSCSFATPEPSIHLKPGLVHGIVSENNGAHGVRIINEAGTRALIQNNELPADQS
ncbi:MAG: hypothetical protein GXY52_05735 [Chloroflexi bacterium]|nr:hypothetical protein [Chloroflexota bacterium]